MKKKFTRMFAIISCFAFCFSNILFPNIRSFATNLDFFDIIDRRAHAQNLVEATVECMSEAKFNKFVANANADVKHDDFWTLHNIDRLPYNIIHILVQNHARNSNPRLSKTELGITYTMDKKELENTYDDWKEVLNTYNDVCTDGTKLDSVIGKIKKFTNYKGKEGSIDLWGIDGNTVYVWEVKPPSYEEFPKRILGLEQLYRYVNIPKTRVGGGLQPLLDSLVFIPGDSINSFIHEPQGEFTFNWGNGFESILYKVNYSVQSDGLVIYHFDRYAAKKQEQEEPETVVSPATDKDYEAVYSYSEVQGIVTSIYNEASEILTYEASNAIIDSYNIINESVLKEFSTNEGYYNNSQDGSSVENSNEMVYIDGEIRIGAEVVLSAVALNKIIKMAKAIIATHTPNSDKASHAGPLAEIAGLVLEKYNSVKGMASAAGVVALYTAVYNFCEILEVNAEDLTDESVYNEKHDEVMEEIKKEQERYEESQDLFQSDPLIINFSGTDEIEFTSLAEGINFDLDNNGFDEKTAWIKNNDGFLAIDLNGNEKIDNGGELFGDRFIMLNGQKSFDGFEALSSLDTNKNGKIDDNDNLFGNVSVNQNETDEEYTLFDQLVVWYGDESRKDFVSLKSLNVDYIDLACFPDPYIYNTDTEDVRSTRREKTSFVYFKDGTARKNISEFWFDVNTTSTVHDGEITVGNVKTIEQAIDDDETGELLELCLAFNYTDDIAQKHYYLKKILYFITDSSDIPIKSRGGNIDARDLHVIETFMGHEFIGVNNDKNPNALAAAALKEIYKNIENSYYNAINLKMSFGGYMTITFENEDENGDRFLDISLLNEVIEKKIENNDYNANILLYDLGVYLKSYDKIHKTNEFIKYRDYYSAKSQEYAEIIELIGNNDTFIGAESNDKYTGSAKVDFIFGEDGNNTLYGSSANDHIYSGYGNDIMNGNEGDDSYYFGMYHGNDVVNDTEGNSKIIFIDGLSVDDYDTSVLFNGSFVLTNKYTGDTITLTDFITHPFNYDFFSYNRSQTVGGGDSREVVEGSDADDYLDASDGFNIFYAGEGNDTIAGGNNIDFMYGGNGDDTLLGRNGTNIIYGEGGNDTIYDGDHSSYLNGGDNDDVIFGGGGDDILDGGAGNDILQGDHGNDTFIYGIGYDIDTLKDAAGEPNTIIIHGYHKSDMNNFRDGSNLIIDFGKNTGDRMIIERFFDYAANSDITFIFDDGTLLSRLDIRAKSLPIYGNGSNYLSGTADDDIIDAGAGDTLICGANGEDTYIFGKGYDHDSIHEWGSDHSFVELKDINSDEITIEMQDGNLNIYVNETEDELTILNFVYGSSTFTYRFADGAEGYVDKNTYEFIFTKQLDPLEEEDITDIDTLESEINTDEGIEEAA